MSKKDGNTGEENVDIAAALMGAMVRNWAAVLEAEVVDRHRKATEPLINLFRSVDQASDHLHRAVPGPWGLPPSSFVQQRASASTQLPV